jgi:quinol monooxygenase YgiN
MSITRINTFRARDDMANTLREFLISVVPIIEQSQGCESCQLLQSEDKPTEFVVLEVWTTVAAHQASAKNIPPEQLHVVMSLLANQPGGSYYSAQVCPHAPHK